MWSVVMFGMLCIAGIDSHSILPASITKFVIIIVRSHSEGRSSSIDNWLTAGRISVSPEKSMRSRTAYAFT